MSHHREAAPQPAGYGFDRALLKQPVAARLEYFDRQVTVLHPRQEQAYLEIWRAMHQPFGVKQLFVVGPSGVGKTTLLRKLRQTIMGEALADLGRLPGYKPICAVLAESPHLRAFHWGRLFRDLLEDLDEPYIDAKVSGLEIASKLATHGSQRIGLGRRPTTDALRDAVQEALRQRQPKAVCIDEAHHLVKVGTARRIKDNADCLKSLVDKSGRLFVLLGTYELLPLRKQGDQLSRRTSTVHFPRYHIDRAEDVEMFKRCLVTFEHYLPLAQRPDLLAEWEFLFAHSVGCIGTLKDWLTRALNAALHELDLDAEGNVRYDPTGAPCTKPARTVTRAHLEQTALPVDDCLTIATLATFGEAELTTTSADADQLQALLRAPPSTRPGMQRPPPNVPPTDGVHPHRAGRGHPGQRKPRRDPVGRFPKVVADA